MKHLNIVGLVLFLVYCSGSNAVIQNEIDELKSKELCGKVLEKTTCPKGAFPEICAGVQSDNLDIINQIKTHCDEIEEPKSINSIIVDSLKPYKDELIAAIIAVLLAALASLKVRMHRLAESAKIAISRLAYPLFEEYESYDSRALNIVLIGEGGSGKTTLIRALSGAPEAAPDIATDDISTYSLVQEVTVENDNSKKRRLFRLYIDDYVGQNFIRALKDESINSRLKSIPSAFPVIVVDLFPKTTEQNGNRFKTFDQDRIDYQLSIYNDVVIQLAMSRSIGTKDIVLFINKIDKLQSVTEKSKKNAEEAYSLLIEKLKDIRGKRVHVIAGSAQNGLGVVGYSEGNNEDRSLLEIIHDICIEDGKRYQ
ncbi:GTPase domain-containing protein [Thiosocius teredinicola]|uniref:GTPase domain-containing protein n=1 Tax=Thiosocius teredinicola TaxID=1973002 RepID=UPI000F7844CF